MFMQVDQINREYKVRALQLHPDKNPDPESAKKFQMLQLAKDVLTDERKRKSYDTWLNSGIQIPFEQWENKKGHSMHWAAPRQMKLSIQGGTQTGPGGGSQATGSRSTLQASDKKSETYLEKFRNYEI